MIYLLSFYVIFHTASMRAKKSVLIYLLGIMCYTIVLFATDNISIYLVYLVPFYTTIYGVLSNERKVDENQRSIDVKEAN